MTEDYMPDIYAIGLQEVDVPLFGSKDLWLDTIYAFIIHYDYIKIKNIKLRGIQMIIFLKDKHKGLVSDVQKTSVKTGFGGLWGNKGAVCVSMVLNDKTSITFVNSHLHAHLDELEQRISDYKRIVGDASEYFDSDYVFWFGDLNFRINLFSGEEIIKKITAKEYEVIQ